MGVLNRRLNPTTKKTKNKGADNGINYDSHEILLNDCDESKQERKKRHLKGITWRSRSILNLIFATSLIVACLMKARSYARWWKSLEMKNSDLNLAHLVLRQKSAGHLREHTFLYFDSRTKERLIQTILVASPAQKQGRRRSIEQLNYRHADISRINFNDPDNGQAFPVFEPNRQCYPMAAWQTENHQTCNKVHEIDKAGAKFINCGASRCTLLVENDHHSKKHHHKAMNNAHYSSSKVVLKVTKLGNWGFVHTKYDMAIRDALALERLTSSPYTLDIYSSCAVSQLVEYSSGGNIHDLLKRSRLQERVGGGLPVDDAQDRHIQFANPAQYLRHQLATPLTKLKIAFQVSSAVAAMHALEEHPNGLPSMVHNDLCCHQFMLVNGVYKLGDFDWVTFQTQTLEESSSSHIESHRKLRKGSPEKEIPKQEVCQTTPISFDLKYLKVLAPEEMAYYDELDQARLSLREWEDEELLNSAKHAKGKQTYRDKLDIYQIGNICYTLLTNWWVWEGYTIPHALLANHQGRQSPFPTDILLVDGMPKQKRAALAALYKVTLMAWTRDPRKRPTAQHLANYLFSAIQGLEEIDENDIVRISVPPLPHNHRFTDSDFNDNLADPPL